MGKLKEKLINGLTHEELENSLNQGLNYDCGYDQWLESGEFIEFVNDELETIKPIYSQSNIDSAIRYASTQVQIEPSEVGKDVYDKLLTEKIEEYLNLHRNEF